MEKTMCRIDAPYGDRYLDEKSDPTERFLQALDESEIDGQSRSLLTKHFSDNWNRIFGSATDLEKARALHAIEPLRALVLVCRLPAKNAKNPARQSQRRAPRCVFAAAAPLVEALRPARPRTRQNAAT